MRSIPAAMLTEIATGQFTEFHCITLALGGATYYYTDADVPIIIDAQSYTPKGFRFDPVNYSKANIVSRATLEIENVDSVMSVLFVGEIVQGSTVTIKKAIVDGTMPTISAVTIYEGTVDDWELDEQTLRLSLASVLLKWSQRPLSNYNSSCRWKVFKGTECQYAGAETWCDRSYQRCVDLGNTANFGGFRWLPSIQDREIWWGQVPKND